MWDKKDQEKDARSSVAGTTPRFEPTASASFAPPLSAPVAARGRVANIGSSLVIKGEVSGSEDLTVEGHVEGKIDLKDHNLTIAASGRVSAVLHAKSITIVGEVTGNVLADEKVEIAETGKLVGDIAAPRVAISDGAQFRGSVEMTKEKASTGTMSSQREKQVAQPAAAVQVQMAGRASAQG